MKIGIMGAMEQEISLLVSHINQPASETCGMREYIAGELLGKDVVAVYSRIGKVAAASTVTTLIERFNVDMIVFTGLAGGVDPSLDIGDVIIADSLVQHDMDASPLPQFSRFEIPLLGKERFSVNVKLVTLAENSAKQFIENKLDQRISKKNLSQFAITTPKIETGLIASGDQFVVDPAAVDDLRSALPDLKAVEMEGAAVAQICYEHEIPMVLFRVISDKANDDSVVDFQAFIDDFACQMTYGITEELIRRI